MVKDNILRHRNEFEVGSKITKEGKTKKIIAFTNVRHKDGDWPFDITNTNLDIFDKTNDFASCPTRCLECELHVHLTCDTKLWKQGTTYDLYMGSIVDEGASSNKEFSDENC